MNKNIDVNIIKTNEIAGLNTKESLNTINLKQLSIILSNNQSLAPVSKKELD